MSNSHPTIGLIGDMSPDRRILTGWVSVDDDGTPPNVRCFRRDQEVGVATFGVLRDDVLQNTGRHARSFEIKVSEQIPLGAFVTGEYAVMDADTKATLEPSVRFRRRGREELLGIVGLGNSPATDEPSKIVVRRQPLDYPRSMTDLSPVWLPVGVTSRNESAILGRDGYAFLVRGTNHLVEQYRSPRNWHERRVLAKHVKQWLRLFAHRKRQLDALGIRYCQMVLPEKNTSLANLIDFPNPMTPLLNEIEKAVGKRDWYFSGSQVLSSMEDIESAWMRYDTHISPTGALEVVRAFLDYLGLTPIPEVQEELPFLDFFQGDLAKRLFGTTIWEPQMSRENDDPLDGGSLPNVLGRFDPKEGAQMGLWRVWRREDAPYDMKVLIFGNSYCGRGTRCPQLNWWFSRLFKDVHFVWTNTVDMDHVKRVKPDLVICQTVERFLVRLPED